MAEPRRRTQAERSAGTRQLLLDAAVRCLHAHGYSATTTMLVAEDAGVSRGAMLHQFRTKADLMTFVVEAVFEQEVAAYGELLGGITDPAERLLAYPEAVWTVLSRPSGVAVLEILQGSRSDATLRDMLEPVQARIEQQALAFTRLAQGDGRREGAIALMRLVVWAMRGLSIADVLDPQHNMHGSVKLLKLLLRAGLETGVLTATIEKEG
ncbi:TetR/AcrR family transcriptional regulator [Sphingomonas hankookensis]